MSANKWGTMANLIRKSYSCPTSDSVWGFWNSN